VAFLFPGPTQATPIDPGLYVLESHPDGDLNPPPYGLRLDGLDGDENHDFTFDFDGPGAAMQMELSADDSSLRIFGLAYGGRDVGGSYEDPQLWEIGFTYEEMIVDGDQLVSDPATSPNRGTITPTESIGGFSAGVPIILEDFFGEHPFSFVLEEGHRGFEGVSGFGWLNHGGAGLENHVKSSDWLFTVIPEPGSILLVGLGVVLIGAARSARRAASSSAPTRR
jgi:hypothetical protein